MAYQYFSTHKNINISITKRYIKNRMNANTFSDLWAKSLCYKSLRVACTISERGKNHERTFSVFTVKNVA